VARSDGRVWSDEFGPDEAKARLFAESFQPKKASDVPEIDGGVEVARIATRGEQGAGG
jgi:hypothetical protein